jgi:hypothetical protein
VQGYETMKNFDHQSAFINAVGEQLLRMHGQYEGAHFRAAFARDNGLRFLTASVLFRASHVASRPTHDYGSLLLVEEWVREQHEALKRLSQLVSGQATIEGQKITGTFTRSRGYAQTHTSARNWIGWRYISTLDHGAPFESFNVRAPLVAPGLRPYLSSPDAISDWVSDMPSSNSVSVADQDCIITMLPDLRARIVSAQWLPGLVRVELEMGVPEDQVELQLMYGEAGKPYDIVPAARDINVDVPGDARWIHLYLVHVTGECIAELPLQSLYTAYGKAEQTVSTQQQTISDLENGENDTVEYKPFTKPMDAKESELVETMVAFANTSGGRLYVGVQDDGLPEGEAAVRVAFRSELNAALKEQVDRLKTLMRERIKPVPVVTVKLLAAHDHPIVLADVERGTQRPYATHDNKMFVRKGATNRLADPNELAALLAPDGPY